MIINPLLSRSLVFGKLLQYSMYGFAMFVLPLCVNFYSL